MRLLLTAPLPRWYLLLCKLSAGTLLSLLQAYAFLLVCAAFQIDLPWWGWLRAFPALLLGGMMLGALGLLLSVYIKQLENFAGTMNFVIVPTAPTTPPSPSADTGEKTGAMSARKETVIAMGERDTGTNCGGTGERTANRPTASQPLSCEARTLRDRDVSSLRCDARKDRLRACPQKKDALSSSRGQG